MIILEQIELILMTKFPTPLIITLKRNKFNLFQKKIIELHTILKRNLFYRIKTFTMIHRKGRKCPLMNEIKYKFQISIFCRN